VAVEKCGKLRFDLGDGRPFVEFDITRERIAAPPRRIEVALHNFERTEHIETAEVLVGIRVAEKPHDRQRIGAVQQYQLPHGILTTEDRAGKRLRKHHLVGMEQDLFGVAVHRFESQHVEKHRIGVYILCLESIITPHDVGCARPEQACGGFDLRNLFGQRRGDGGIELRTVPAVLRIGIMSPQLEYPLPVGETTVGGEVVIGIRKDQQTDGQPQRKRHHAGKGAAAQFTQVT